MAVAQVAQMGGPRLDPNPAPQISVGGNVEGSIVIGDNNFVVHSNFGTIVYKQATPQARLREVVPRPPRALRSFQGRARELSDLESFIQEGTPVLVNGLDGVGKSSLLKQAANTAAAGSTPHGVLFLESSDQEGVALGSEDILQQAFEALYESDPPLKVTFASARTYLSNTIPLVLLDGFRLSEEDLDRLADVFPKSPILACSSQALEPEAYEPYRLKTLPLNEATQLLAARARFDLSAVEAERVARICELLYGLPLALVTVANAMREFDLTIDQVLAGLQAISVTGVRPDQAGIERSAKFVQGLLSGDEAHMAALTAATPGISTDRAWLEGQAGGPATSQRMENLALLQPNSPRLRLHPAYAPYFLAEENLAENRQQIMTRLLANLDNNPLDFDYIKNELGNLLGLFEWLVEQSRWKEAIALGRRLDAYLTLRGLWEAWGRVLSEVLAGARMVGERAVEGWALHQLGTRQMGYGNATQANLLLHEALEIRKELGDLQGMAHTWHNLNLLHLGYASPPGTEELVYPGISPNGGSAGAPPATSDSGRKPARRRWSMLLVVGMLLLLLSALCVGSGGANIDIGTVRNLIPFMPNTATPTATQTPMHTASPTVTQTASATATATFTATPTQTPTATFTATLTRTPTITLTPTQSLTPTITLTPTLTAFTFPEFIVTANQAFCRFGPGQVYLRAGDLFSGDSGEVRGRNRDTSWLYVRLDGTEKYCWVSRTAVDVIGKLETVEVTPFRLPETPDSPLPSDVVAVRKGNTVTITWKPVPVAADDLHGYLLELSICQNGLYMALPVLVTDTTYIVTDEQTCAKPSKGQIRSVTVRGYSTPVSITWP